MSSRIIKKYANRRLYDTEDSQYVTLKDIKKIITLGQDVHIIDDISKQDLTQNLLLQIVSEQELDGTPLLSASVLKQLIRFHGHPKQSLMSSFLDNSVTDFISRVEIMKTPAPNAIGTHSSGNLQVNNRQTDNAQKDPAKNDQVSHKLKRQFFSFMDRNPSKNNNKGDEGDNS